MVTFHGLDQLRELYLVGCIYTKPLYRHSGAQPCVVACLALKPFGRVVYPMTAKRATTVPFAAYNTIGGYNGHILAFTEPIHAFKRPGGD